MNKYVCFLAIVVGLTIGSGCTSPPEQVRESQDTGIERDVSEAADSGAQDVISDVDGTENDVSEGDVVEPGLRLTDYLRCVEDSDCPTGTGECLKAVELSETSVDGTVKTVSLGAALGGDFARGEGICSRSCTKEGDRACGEVSSSCQLVFLLEESAGEGAQIFGSICRPSLEVSLSENAAEVCSSCTGQQGCGTSEARCWDLLAGGPAEAEATGFCLASCDDDGGCALGFSCDIEDAGRGYCRPTHDTCTSCYDRDGDGFGGSGICTDSGGEVLAHDCNDGDKDVNPDGLEICDGVDNNCNGKTDEGCFEGMIAYKTTDPSEDEEVNNLQTLFEVKAVECAPGEYWTDIRVISQNFTGVIERVDVLCRSIEVVEDSTQVPYRYGVKTSDEDKNFEEGPGEVSDLTTTETRNCGVGEAINRIALFTELASDGIQIFCSKIIVPEDAGPHASVVVNYDGAKPSVIGRNEGEIKIIACEEGAVAMGVNLRAGMYKSAVNNLKTLGSIQLLCGIPEATHKK